MRGCTLMWFTSERAKGRTSAMRGMGRSPATIAWRRARPLRCGAPRAAPGLGPGDAHRRPPLRLRAVLGRCRFAPPLELEGEDAAAERPSADVGLARQGVQHAPIVGDLAAKNHLPATYPQTDYIDAGGLMFYGPSINDLFRRAAIYVDKILKGVKPGDLPVEQPMKFEFMINLKAAKQIGLTIPQSVLYRTDKVIK